jgi:hypothetical protein
MTCYVHDVPELPLYQLDISKIPDIEYGRYIRGGRGGIDEDSKYVILGRIEDTERYILFNVTIGKMVEPQTLELFKRVTPR